MKWISVCFRCADRAGQSCGPSESDVKHELCGPLHQTGRPLAAAGQPKGKVTNNLLGFLHTLRPASHYLHFSVFGSDTDPNCPSGLCQSSFSLLHMDVNSSRRHRCHLVFDLKARFPCKDTTLIMALVIHCFLSCTFTDIGYICCNPHISHLAPAFVPSCSFIS